MSLHILDHPISRAAMTKLRHSSTTPSEFRECIEKISFMLGVEATKDLEEIPVSGETSMGEFAGTEISTRVALAPVLRAGIGMTETLLTLLPDARVYHLGIFRDSNTDAPVQYYSMIRKNPPIDKVLLLDPMVGTGGTSCAAVKILLEVGVSESNIKLLCVLASREGIQRVQKEYPALEIHVSTIDDDLVQKGRHKLISPGFGDAGDRIFNTL
ncbi:UDP-N-acetylglucosamine 1-carboxyvinyltransferase [Flagelloscypha sp. PMI_526]|nr:UDP-N-acetylglucosamine 1-carboxyvinyltransferase [Flagelloscypha sp. PMI_526]